MGLKSQNSVVTHGPTAQLDASFKSLFFIDFVSFAEQIQGVQDLFVLKKKKKEAIFIEFSMMRFPDIFFSKKLTKFS